jgi:pectate lyase
MKRFLLTLLLLAMAFILSAQCTYLVVIKNIETKDSAEYVCKLFKDLSVSKCEFNEKEQSFLIYTKTQLPRTIVQDYLEGNEYILVSYSQYDEKNKAFIIPNNNKKCSEDCKKK